MDASVSYDPSSGTTSVTLQLLDLHGDVAGTANGRYRAVGDLHLSRVRQPPNPDALTSGRGKTRAQAGVGNLTLIGVGLYDPATGRFLQPTP